MIFFCTGVQFDVILADYLVGAMEGFTPFTQDTIFNRLKRHLRPHGGELFIIGQEPYGLIVDAPLYRNAPNSTTETERYVNATSCCLFRW